MAGRGWYDLLAIYKADREEREQRRQAGPLSCPNDGTVFQQGPDGTRYCPFDGYRPDEHEFDW